LTIAGERLSRRHVQRAIVNARVTDPAGAVDAGFLDVVVAPETLLDTAVARATELAETLDPAAYRATVARFRGPTLATMADQIADDRAAGVAVSA
jgi:enoyl-CoA hydratase